MMATFTEAPPPDVRAASPTVAAAAMAEGPSGAANGGNGASIPASVSTRPSPRTSVAPSTTDATRAEGALPGVQADGSFGAAAARTAAANGMAAARKTPANGERITKRRIGRTYHGRAIGSVAAV